MLASSQSLLDSTRLQIEADARRRELIAEGINPALADQLVQIEQNFDKEKDILDARILELETTIAQLDAEKEVTKELERQLEIFKKRREELGNAEDDAKNNAIGEELSSLGKAAKEAGEKLKDLLDIENQLIGAANMIGEEFGKAFKGIIDGSMSVEDAFKRMLDNMANYFFDYAAQILQAAITKQLLDLFVNLGLSAAGGGGGAGAAAGKGAAKGGGATFASGGFITSPTMAMMGEGGENEFVIPESKMSSAMQRWNAGARGDAVVDGASRNQRGTTQDGVTDFISDNMPINISTGPVMAFEGKNYVTQSQFAAGVQSAAKQGEARALRKLQMSPAARRRAGI